MAVALRLWTGSILSRGRTLFVGLTIATIAACSPGGVTGPRNEIPTNVPGVPAGTELATAKTSFEAGNFGYAARYFQMALDAAPNDMEACLGLAASYDWLHRFDLSDRTYSTCRTIGGETFAYHNNVGFSYILRGEYGRASVSLAQARTLQPGHPVIETNLRILRDVSSG